MAPGSNPFAWPLGAQASQDAPPPAPITPKNPQAAEIRVGPNGHIEGVDGMLDQICAALTKHAGPMLVRDVLPAVKADTGLQKNIGAAVGQTVASELSPWIAIGAGALGVLAIVQVLKWRQASREQARPRRRRTRR